MAAPSLAKLAVLPLTIAILLALFLAPAARHRAHGRAASSARSWLVWFLLIGGLGACARSAAHPEVLEALVAGARGRASSSATAYTGFVVLGAVVLAITGAEALYADMGHFGAGPIRRSRGFVAVFPALLPELLRAGRAAPAAIRRSPINPFFAIVPGWALIPIGHGRRRDGHGHRLAGAHLRRLLAHPAGGAARLLPARRRCSHTSERRRRDRSTSPRSTTALLAVACVALVLAFRELEPRSPPPTASPSPARWPSRPSPTTWSSPRPGTGRSGAPCRSLPRSSSWTSPSSRRPPRSSSRAAGFPSSSRAPSSP